MGIRFSPARLFAWLSYLLSFEAALFDGAHQLRLVRPRDAALFGFAEGFGVQIVAALFF